MKSLQAIFACYFIFNGFAVAQTGSGDHGILRSGATAHAQKEIVFNNKQPARLTFDFNGSNAWLNHEGDWGIEGYVKHPRLRCATYQVAVRFGKGSSGCLNVDWLTPYQNGTFQKQCNSAPAKHVGGGHMYELENRSNEVTCAQVKINCSGQCEK